MPLEETLSAFDELIRGGKVAHAGLSNFDGAQVAEAAGIAAAGGLAPLTNLQNNYSLLDRAAADDVFAVCARHGIGFTAFSPLVGGWLTGKYWQPRAYPRGSRMTLRPDPYRHLERPGTFAALAKLERAAADWGMDLATLALAWVLADPGVSAVIVGPRRPEQLEPALAALEVSLSEAERAKLTELVRPEG